MASVSLPALGRVAVCGGTHGNELSGVYLVQELERQRREKGDGVWPIPVTTVLTNPRAVKECRRYIDTDMNRCFSSDTLSSPVTDSSPYEVRRAQELNNLLGPKGSPDAVDMICDLHNTTSNMGLTLIHYTSSDWVTLHICKYLQASSSRCELDMRINQLAGFCQTMMDASFQKSDLTSNLAKITQVPVRVLVLDFTVSDAYNLESVSKHGFTLEVGPQPQGVIRSDIFVIMKKAVDLTIDWIHKFNSGTVFEGGELEAYKFIRSVDYPRNPETGTLTAAIHPQLQVLNDNSDQSLMAGATSLRKKIRGKRSEEEVKEHFFCLKTVNGYCFLKKREMASVSLPALGRVAVCGGTHGNELSGVYLVQEMERQRREKGDGVWPIPVTTVLTNPRAVKECRRYIDTDMNRCFSSDTLSSPVADNSPYEVRRAHELNNQLGPKGSPDAIDLICDLHNTTSNMGLTLIHYTTSDWTKITKVPVRVLVMDVPYSDAYSLESVSKHGFSIEVGPQPHGVVRADIFLIMKEAVDLTIEWIHKYNSGTVFEAGEVEIFKKIKSVDYPRDPETGSVSAAIHPQLQDRDFCLLRNGDPMFLTFSGETVKYKQEEELHPLFINECAYYEKAIAFHLGKKMMLTVPSVQVQKD
ncbi:hypothetical protein DNTS_029094 [Danionella cerebrum]|uniref:N-acyl-aromatic-L-amino acid amidohydrolase n=1 Tax=Danionella cerebrum TaxID=2873325 RepID=A0A553PJ60_9TELE|nr:hypothetical protein DNTS_029094 [Danionella translucida]